MDQFQQEKHTFDEYTREVRRYYKLVDEITYKSVKVTKLLSSVCLNRQIAGTAEVINFDM